ncbi:MAG: hemolysin III family protein [Burkholderiales bacterium]|nr:hemolysin III family protein [Burkholderiales bacterium]
MQSRPQTAGEEIANSAVHGVGLLAAIAMAPVLIVTAVHHSTTGGIVGAGIFCGTMVLVFLSSMLYHMVREGQFRQHLLKADHGAIYLFIAGSYTPFALRAAHDHPLAWYLLALVWSVALGGVILRACGRLTHPLWSTGFYLLMGWLVLIAAYPLASHLAANSVAWLVAGGVAYTVGVVFFLTDARLRFGHAVWHGFVLLGSACHYTAVWAGTY